MDLLKHAKGCTPLTPCAACDIVHDLRDSLPPETFERILRKAKELRDEPKRRRRNRTTSAPAADLLA